MKNIAAVFLFFLVGNAFAAGAEGPFGLSWGMTRPQVESLGVKLEPLKSQGGIAMYRASSLPKNISMAEAYTLSFDKAHNLQRVRVISKDISADAYGTEGKAKYSTLKEGLISKYGQPTNGLETVGMKLWKEADEFYQCLAYDGCGLWVALFKDAESGHRIALALKGLSRGKGYIDLTYEGPRWSDVVGALKNKEAESDANAL